MQNDIINEKNKNQFYKNDNFSACKEVASNEM